MKTYKIARNKCHESFKKKKKKKKAITFIRKEPLSSSYFPNRNKVNSPKFCNHITITITINNKMNNTLICYRFYKVISQKLFPLI